MKGFDSHIHLCAAEMPMTLRRNAIEQRIGMLECSTDLADAPEVLALAEGNANVYAAIGIHPMYCPGSEAELQQALEGLKRYWVHPCCAAVGEIGLDYRPQMPERALQQKLFAAQLDYAGSRKLPVSLHCVRAAGDLCSMLRSAGALQGVIHGFSMSREVAQVCMAAGLCIGIGPGILREQALRLQQLAAELPWEAILIETDSPTHLQGQQVTPDWLEQVAERLAVLRGCGITEVYERTTANGRRVFAESK